MTYPTDQIAGEELELLRTWVCGDRGERRAANDEIDRRVIARAMSRAACRLRAVVLGKGHRALRKRAGNRLAFTYAYLLATGPVRRGVILVKNVSGRRIGAGELVTVAPPAEGRPAGDTTTA